MRWFSEVFVLLFILMLSCGVRAQGGVPGMAPAFQFNWYIPSLRENGDSLSLAAIGGYELRYRIKGTSKFKSIVIRGASYKSYLVRGLPNGSYEFQIATFDADGLYSIFVPINYKLTM